VVGHQSYMTFADPEGSASHRGQLEIW